MIKFEKYSKYFNIIKVIPDTDNLIGYSTIGRMDHLKDIYYLAFPKLKDKKLEQLIIKLLSKEKINYIDVYDFSIVHVDIFNREFFHLTYNQYPVVLLSSLVLYSEVGLNEYLNEFLTEDIDTSIRFFKNYEFLEENQKALEILKSLKEDDIEFFDLTPEFSFKPTVWTISDLNILGMEKVEEFNELENSKIKKINKKNVFIIK